MISEDGLREKVDDGAYASDAHQVGVHRDRQGSRAEHLGREEHEARRASREKVDLMAQLAGLRLRERWNGWGRGPYGPGSALHVSVYEKDELKV